MADIKTTSEVEPALINGSGRPVGGMEPDTTSYCTKKEQFNCSLYIYSSLPHFLQNLSLCELIFLHSGHSFLS